jgi:LPPG:FO 2-phospho-L-lactate transferase
MRIAALAGGVGASKLLLGLSKVVDPRALTIIVNTGDDIALHGLEISPDLDIVTYTLAGVVNHKTGWGIKGDTFFALRRLAIYGCPDWFHLGDRDLATHIFRTERLRGGSSLSQVADSIRRKLGVKIRILPMSDHPVRTTIETGLGRIHFQEYLVKLRAKPAVRDIRFEGSKSAKPAPGVLETLREAEAIVICPSNPLISIGPILAVPGVREALRKRRKSVLAISPIVGGKSLKGPSDRMLKQMGFDSSALAVAKLYRDFCGTLLIDRADESERAGIEALGVRVVVGPTVMRSLADKVRLAQFTMKNLPGHAQRLSGSAKDE